MSKLSEEEVSAIALEKGFLVDNYIEYDNLNSDLTFICSKCGEKFVSNVKTIKAVMFMCPMCNKQEVKKFTSPPNKKGYRVIGFDQATQHFGISIYDNEKLVYYNCINFTGDIDDRLVKIANFIEFVVREWLPDYVVFEDIQLQNNPYDKGYATFKTLAQLLGIVTMLLKKHKVPFKCVLNKVWQAQFSIAGKTREEQKRNVIKYVKTLFNIDVNDDIADAILIGKYGTIKHEPVKKLF